MTGPEGPDFSPQDRAGEQPALNRTSDIIIGASIDVSPEHSAEIAQKMAIYREAINTVRSDRADQSATADAQPQARLRRGPAGMKSRSAGRMRSRGSGGSQRQRPGERWGRFE